MNDKEMYAAKTQRHITLVLLYGLLGLIAGIVMSAFAPWPIKNEKMLGIVEPLITGVLTLTSGAVGFWIARHRPNGDDTDPNPTQPVNPATEQK